MLGIAAQFLAFWTRLPSILILLAFGIALGSFINPDALLDEIYQSNAAHVTSEADTGSSQAGESQVNTRDQSVGPEILFPLVSLSVAVILFEGGLSLRISELKNSGSAVFRLCTGGALLTWVLSTLSAWGLLGLEFPMACLLGAVLVVTGPTVIAPLIRYIRPSGRVGSIAKWEGIVIDPIGAILAVLVFEYYFHGDHASGISTLMTLVLTFGYGTLIGVAFSGLLLIFLRRYWIPDHLHGVAVLAMAMAAFAISNFLQMESGLVAVTVMGICLANQKQVSIEHIIEFKENLGVFLISCLFIVLGSRLNIMDLWELGLPGLLFLVVLILVVRPLSVFVSMVGTNLSWQERTFLSMLAPRGIVAAAVTSVFALQIQLLAREEPNSYLGEAADKLVPICFLVIVGTVFVYGLGAAPLARWLGLAAANPQGILFAGAQRWVCDLAKIVHDAGYQVAIVDTNYSRVARAQMNGLPAYCSSILSDHLPEHLDFSGIGRMLACTNNDAINTLAAQEYKHFFGSKNSYQLPPIDGESIRSTIDKRLRGRELFGDQLNEEQIYLKYQAGYRFKKTKLSSEFDFQQFQELYDHQAYVLMVIEPGGSLAIRTTENQLAPESNQTVIALVPPGKQSVPETTGPASAVAGQAGAEGT